MNVFHIIIGLVQAIFLKVFPSLGYEGVINTQISVYNKIKKRAPEMSENESLNYLINSRIRSIPRVASKEEEYAHYTPLLEDANKTLEDVIWAIVEYEYVLSREEQLFNKLSKMGLSEPEIAAARDDQMAKPRRYIKESIKKKVKSGSSKLMSEERDATQEQHKKIWHDILRKSKEFPKDISERFLIADNIAPLKFKENHDYYIMDTYGDHKPTPSCFHPQFDMPSGYPYWFASAYPDVVKYFSTIEDEEFTRLFEDMGFTEEDLKDFNNPKMIDQEGYFRVDILYKLKELYKELHPNAELECQ